MDDGAIITLNHFLEKQHPTDEGEEGCGNRKCQKRVVVVLVLCKQNTNKVETISSEEEDVSRHNRSSKFKTFKRSKIMLFLSAANGQRML